MKILITGVHGFVGTNLVKALSKEHDIFGLDIVDPIKDGVKFTFKWDDLDKEKMILDVDAIIHLAGKAHDTKNQSKARTELLCLQLEKLPLIAEHALEMVSFC